MSVKGESRSNTSGVSIPSGEGAEVFGNFGEGGATEGSASPDGAAARGRFLARLTGLVEAEGGVNCFISSHIRNRCSSPSKTPYSRGGVLN